MYKLMGLLLLLAPLPAAARPAPGEWKAFTSKAGGYEVQLPGTPQEKSHPVKTSAGSIYVALAILDLKKGEGNYLVGYSELPDGVVKADTEEKHLDNARDGAVSSSRGKLKGEKHIKLDGHTGREVDIEIDAKTVVRAR